VKVDIVRMNKIRMVKRITKRWPVAIRKIGRPRIRWKVDFRMDLGTMKTRNWGKMAMER